MIVVVLVRIFEDSFSAHSVIPVPIRIWIRTATKEVTEGLTIFALRRKEMVIYQAHPDSVHVVYYYHVAMLNNGWILD